MSGWVVSYAVLVLEHESWVCTFMCVHSCVHMLEIHAHVCSVYIHTHASVADLIVPHACVFTLLSFLCLYAGAS